MDSFPYLLDIATYEKHRARARADAIEAARRDGYEPQGEPEAWVVLEVPVSSTDASALVRVSD